jgi:methylmalonyl-CoA mutase
MNLTDQFKPFTEEDFAAAFQKEVKNGDFRELLTWHTHIGIDVLPFYHQSDAPVSVMNFQGNDWNINQKITISDFKKANTEALQVLNNGATSLTFSGKITSFSELEILLDGIEISCIELNFKESGKEIVSFLQRYCSEKKISPSLLKGSFYLPSDQISSEMFVFPNRQLSFADGIKLHNAGADMVQQLGYLIAEGKEILQSLIDKNIHPETAVQTIRFDISVGQDFFFEICKINALRILWQNIVAGYCDKTMPLYIHAETSEIWMADEDIHNNLIRASFQSISAVLGGADSLYVRPYTKNDDSARISTNVQLVIKEESFLDKVANVGGGSFYIREITHQLVEKSWKLFQETEKTGGFSAALKSELIQKNIFASASLLKKEISEGKIKVIGVNKQRTDKSEKTFSSFVYSSEVRKINLFN